MSTLNLAQAVLENLVDGAGNLTPVRAAAQLYDTATLRSQLLPAIQVHVADLEGGKEPGAGPSLLLALLRPSLELSGPAGTKVVAPAGMPNDSRRALNLAVLLGVVLGVPFLAGYLLRAATEGEPHRGTKP